MDADGLIEASIIAQIAANLPHGFILPVSTSIMQAPARHDRRAGPGTAR
jgi:hypothetical protein